jgi:hypothetical protein
MKLPLTILSCLLFVIAGLAQKNSKTLITTYKINLSVDTLLYCHSQNQPIDIINILNKILPSDKKNPTEYNTFIKRIHLSASTGKIKAYHPSHEVIDNKLTLTPITLNQISKIGVDTIHMIQYQPEPPYEEYENIMVSVFNLDDIVLIEFMERWTINRQTMKIKKRIIAYALHRKINDPLTNEFRGTSRMYWIKL